MAKRRVGRYVAAIDLGSSRVRCLVVGGTGRIHGLASAPLPVRTPPALAPLGKELPPGTLWSLICSLMRQAIAEAGIAGGDVAAVSAVSQREGMAVVDAAGHELYLAPNTDLRAFIEGQTIDSQHQDKVYRATGHLPSFLFASAKLRWLQANAPAVWERARWVLSLDAWLACKLGAEPALEQAMAVELGLLRFDQDSTPTSLALKPAGSRMPPIVRAGEVIGAVSVNAARRTGLRPGTPIAAGGPDTQAGLLGIGVASPGQAAIVGGWSAPVQMVLNKPVLDEGMRTWSGAHMLAGLWVLESTAAEAGYAYRWVQSTFFPNATDAALARLAAKVPPGANGAVAWLGPKTANMAAVGAGYGGLLYPLLSSVEPTKRDDLLRATLENIAFAIKGNLEQIEEIVGQRAVSISFGGGMSGNQALAGILADVLGREVAVARRPEVTGLGAAMCAAVAGGLSQALGDAVSAMASPLRFIAPDSVHAMEYPEYYHRWLTAGRGLENLGAQL